jgi:hypothetical protein
MAHTREDKRPGKLRCRTREVTVAGGNGDNDATLGAGTDVYVMLVIAGSRNQAQSRQLFDHRA